ncbi:MAG: DMT family transporter [Rhodospirillales bacterium]|nr:DMT family transporter [Rhodospirillales bacterium]
MKMLSDNIRAALFMSLSMGGFVLNDTFMKIASQDLSLFQAILVRGLFATSIIGLMAWRKHVLFVSVCRADRLILGLRLVGEIGGTICFLTALFHMPIANATAILQALPLAVTLASAVFLKEPVGWRRYTAIAVGFVGVLIVIRPGSDGFNSYSFWALGAVVFIVLRDLATRQLSSAVPSLFVAFTTALGITVTAALLSPSMEWHPVETRHVQILAIAALFLIVGYLFSVMTMRIGEVSFASPFRYTNLIWAILIGVVIFGDPLDQWTLTGSFIVVGTGVYSFYRERQRQKKMA